MADLHWLKIPLTPKAHAGVLAEAKARGILPARLVLVALADYLGRAARTDAALHEAWRDYAAKAARPYAWSTFANTPMSRA